MHTWWTWDNQQGQVYGTPIDPQKLVQYLSTTMCEHVWALIPNKQTCESWWWLMNADEHFIVFCSWLQFLVARTKVFFGWSEKNRLSNTNFLCANQFPFASRNLEFDLRMYILKIPEMNGRFRIGKLNLQKIHVTQNDKKHTDLICSMGPLFHWINLRMEPHNKFNNT